MGNGVQCELPPGPIDAMGESSSELANPPSPGKRRESAGGGR